MMANNDIKVGDLVMIVKPTECCNNFDSLGEVHAVINIIDSVKSKIAKCSICGKILRAIDLVQLEDGYSIEKRRVKKIPPLSELETIDTREHLKCPV